MIRTLALALLLAAPPALLAQAPMPRAGGNPFDEGGMPAEGMPPEGMGPMPGDMGMMPPGAEAPFVPPPDTPAVVAVRDSNPTTPIDLLKAAETMLDLGRPDETKKFLAKLIAAKPDLTTLALAQKHVGPGLLFRFLRERQIQPEGADAANLVLSGATAYARDPGRVQAMVAALFQDDAAIRDQAYGGLIDAGDAAVVPLLTALTKPGDEAGLARVRLALTNLGQSAVEPLVAALATRSDTLRAQAALALGELKSRRALAHLAYPAVAGSPELKKAAGWAMSQIVGAAPSKEEVSYYLRTQIDSLLAGKRPLAGDYEDMVRMFVWNEKDQTLMPVRVAASDASLLVAAQLAADLYDLDPKNIDHRRIHLLTMLEAAKIQGDPTRPLPAGPGTPIAKAVASGREAVEEVLVEAIRTGRLGAAAAAAEALGAIGDQAALHSRGAAISPLAAALTHKNPRLRFAAAAAIIKLDPQERYPGSSYFAEALGHMASSVGARRAIVAHPNPTEAQSLVGILSTMGYEGEPVFRGGQVVTTAAASPDVELILLSDGIDHPRLTELLQQIRQDYRTATIPVALIGRSESLPDLHRLADADRASIAFPRPQDAESMAFLVRQLLAQTARTTITRDERSLHSRVALDALAQLAAEPAKYRFYDLQRQEPAVQRAVRSLDVAVEACRVLGLLASPSAQRTLVDLASQHPVPLPIREAAAQAFATAVKRKRVLLTTDEIAEQYLRYNRAKNLDGPTQMLLASILDSIETPSREQAAKDNPPKAE